MQRLTSAVAFTMMLGSLGTGAFAADATMDQQQKRSSKMGASESDTMKNREGKSVSGEVLRIEGDTYTIKQTSGKEVRLTINANTKRDCHAEKTSDGRSSSQDSLNRGIGDPSKDVQKDSARSADQAANDPNQNRANQSSDAQRDRSAMNSASMSGTDCSFNVGDKIEAQVSEQGAATTLSKKPS